jgi:hypothetical protein
MGFARTAIYSLPSLIVLAWSTIGVAVSFCRGATELKKRSRDRLFAISSVVADWYKKINVAYSSGLSHQFLHRDGYSGAGNKTRYPLFLKVIIMAFCLH